MQQICFVPSVLVAAALVVTTSAHAQRFSEIPLARPGQEDVQVSFEVATVKENPAPAGPPEMAINPSGEFTAVNVTLLQLILVAYDVRAYQIVGGPEWMASQFFDIAAEAPDDFEMEDTKAMMRRLLEKRFGLAVSDDIPFGSIFMAVREQLGLKLEPTNADVEALVIESAHRPTLD